MTGLNRLHVRVRWLALAAVLAAAAPLFAQPSPAAPGRRRIFGNPALRQYAPSRAYHVENYRLRLKIFERQGRIEGTETITLRPFASRFQRFFLDSSGLAIQRVQRLSDGGAAIPLHFDRSDPKLWITLDRPAARGQTVRLRIAYSAAPKGRGLTFIRPSVRHPNLWEVWSYGWPENNHYWFPCWDYPNDKATSETIITVPAGQLVVSNGHLAGVRHEGAWTTYDWIESVPHSSYLISIAAGTFREVRQHLGKLPVEYFVPPYVSAARALRSFHLTPDMIAFYAHVYGVPYPYGKYAQVAAHDFGGGLENISATTLTDTTLHSARADPDFPSTELVAHELAHQWFGDLVTERSWASVWLSEGFATYSAALYLNHHQGPEAYRYQIWQDQNAARNEDLHQYRRPMVDYHYLRPWGMMGATTYQKGAAVLAMMRDVLDELTGAGPCAAPTPSRASAPWGPRPPQPCPAIAAGEPPVVPSPEEPFFRSLRQYLQSNRARNVDDADLLTAIRRTTGQNLQWFFHEWVYRGGFPQYQVSAEYDSAQKSEAVTIRQTQTRTALTPLFRMPIELAFYGAGGGAKTLTVWDEKQQQRFLIPLGFRPRFIAFDPHDKIYKTLDFPQPAGSLIAAAETAPAMMTRLWAAGQLGQAEQGRRGAAVAALSQVLAGDHFYGVRIMAAQSLGKLGGPAGQSALLDALHQPDSHVRAAAVTALGRFHDPDVYAALKRALARDPSYAVEAAAARALGQADAPGAFDVLAAALRHHPSRYLLPGLMEGLAATGDPRAKPLLEHLAATTSGRAHYMALRLLHRPIPRPR